MSKRADLEKVVRRRLEAARTTIIHSEQCDQDGTPLAAEWDLERLRARLMQKAALTRDEADAVTVGIRAFQDKQPRERAELWKRPGAEAIWGSTIDFVGSAFLERGYLAARAVGRVAFRDGRAQGTGFLVADGIFLTNHHVLESVASCEQFCVEFEYELDLRDQPRSPTRFTLDPGRLFLTDSVEGLDFTLVALGPALAGTLEPAELGWCALSGEANKHALGELANIVQHPDGRYKEVVLRENRLVSRLDLVLHYVADTQPGSSGSPVFNNEWRPIALHHWGGPWRQTFDPQGRPVDRQVNEGIRISAIVEHLRGRLGTLSPQWRALVEQVLTSGERTSSPVDRPAAAPWRDPASPRLGKDGSVTWRLPIEVSVRLPQMSAEQMAAAASTPVSVSTASDQEAKLKPSQDYGNRSGYKPRFLGLTVPAPGLSRAQEQLAARNREAEAGDSPFELKYHHFSIVMNARRRLAFYTACNIDGASSKKVDRDTGTVTDLDPSDPGLEEALASEGAEASESWYDDRRLDASEYAGKDIYQGQVVPGYLDTRSMGRTLRMFQRGHLVRRMDPAWGSTKMARLADADTFHWTNCSPQVGFFNMGRGPRVPGSGGGKLWRAVENFVLRNAVADETRVCSFTGPIFDDRRDRAFRSIQVPGRFWKIVAWSEEGQLRSLAMIADQRPVIDVWPEALGESYSDVDELDRVEDFLSSVEEVARLTKLDLGVLVDADVRANQESLKVASFDDVVLRPATRRKVKLRTVAAHRVIKKRPRKSA